MPIPEKLLSLHRVQCWTPQNLVIMNELNVSELRFLLDTIVSKMPKELCLSDEGKLLDPDEIMMVQFLYKVVRSLSLRVDLPF